MTKTENMNVSSTIHRTEQHSYSNITWVHRIQFGNRNSSILNSDSRHYRQQQEYQMFCYQTRNWFGDYVFKLVLFYIASPHKGKREVFILLCPQFEPPQQNIRPVWSESSQCAQWVAQDLTFHHADSEDSDQIGRMPRLIWVFARHTVILLVSFVVSRVSAFPFGTRGRL